jgi:hypothetical protein
MEGWMLLHWLVGFPLGLFIANLAEWLIHKHALHGRGRKKESFWSFHWYEHHGASRKHLMLDPAYESASLLEWNARTKELASLCSGLLLWIPMLVLGIAPGLAAAFIFSAGNYYYRHRRAHRDPEWARRHLPWHVDHHMGADQDANWCVSYPWWDWILGTRQPYVGTAKEEADRARRGAAEESVAHGATDRTSLRSETARSSARRADAS